MTQEQLNQVIFYCDYTNKEVIETSYQDYLDEFGSDETTSPRGVEERLHIREIEEMTMKHVATGEMIWESDYNDLDEAEQDPYNYFGECTKEWQVWSWGVGGNHPHYTGTSFDNEVDAEMFLYDCKENYVQEKNWDAPCIFYTEEEAQNDLIQSIADNDGIDKDVAASIYRKSKIVKERRAYLDKLTREKATAEYEARKARLAIEVTAEAASLVIDDEFKQAVKEASLLSGNEKSNKCASALKGLLQRNGKDKIESDFWQVFRIIKAKIN